MKRRLFTVLAALSLLLCVATVVMWVHSYKDDARHPQAWGVIVRDDLGYFVASHCGRIILAEHHITPVIVDRSSWRVFIVGYGKFVAALPNGTHASEDECYPSLFPQKPTRVPFFTTANDVMFIGVGGPPPNLLRAHIQTVSAPYWPWLILLTLPLVASIMSGIRRRRLCSDGHCRVCGYDLRATPERRPECGTVPGARA